jgi:soluble lytic murein transglycosylase
MNKPLEVYIFRGFLLLVILLSLSANSCANPPRTQGNFYYGLLNKPDERDREKTIWYFEKALNDTNVYIRQAAAEELANLMYAGAELSSGTMEKVRNEASGAWGEAFASTGKTPDKDKALKFLLSFEQGSAVSSQARLYTLREFEKQEVSFSEHELAAINGHYAVFRQQYYEALIFFRKFMLEPEPPADAASPENGSPNAGARWGSLIPKLFINYPGLINDLGRAFQYTSSGNEGRDLFLLWESNLAEAMADDDDLRYRLNFFAARIARRRGANDQAFSLFEKARVFSPDGGQSDACIWYLLDLSLNKTADVFLGQLEGLVKYWDAGTYFDDILEKNLQALTSKKDWKNIIRAFDIIKETGAASKAAYAWKIARLMEEKYLTAADIQAAAAAIKDNGAAGDSVEEYLSAAYMRFAYESGNGFDFFSLYYRSLSASALGLPVLELKETEAEEQPPVRQKSSGRASNKRTAAASTGGADKTPAFEFLFGFFEHDAEDLAVPYIRAFERDLSPEEMRAICQALARAGMYAQSIRHSSRYINREGYIPTMEDMELLFPRPYRELVETYAAEHDIPPSLIYGLIRTESAFQSSVVSRAGAVGLTQLMPDTAREMALRIRRSGGPDFFNEERSLDLNDPDLNIHIGAFYLNYLINYFKDPLISLMAYNGGMNRIRRLKASNAYMPSDIFLETVSVSETRNYGRQVMAAAAVYDELYYQK